jgi:hypothetical protein
MSRRILARLPSRYEFIPLALRRDLEQMAKDKEVDAKARVDVHHLEGELTVAIFKLYTESPTILAARHKFPETSLTSSS